MSEPFISGLNFQDDVSFLETIIMTPVSLPGGPLTELGGQKDFLYPSKFVVAANECEVSVSDRIAMST